MSVLCLNFVLLFSHGQTFQCQLKTMCHPSKKKILRTKTCACFHIWLLELIYVRLNKTWAFWYKGSDVFCVSSFFCICRKRTELLKWTPSTDNWRDDWKDSTVHSVWLTLTAFSYKDGWKSALKKNAFFFFLVCVWWVAAWRLILYLEH